jgi:hypothetical protein
MSFYAAQTFRELWTILLHAMGKLPAEVQRTFGLLHCTLPSTSATSFSNVKDHAHTPYS